MKMTKFTCVVPDVINHIVNMLNVKDILNLSLTCRYMSNIIHQKDNEFWRKKFFLTWHHLKPYYDESLIDETHFKQECIANVECRTMINNYISSMQELHFGKTDLTLTDMADLQPLFCPEMNAHPRAYHFIMDELCTIINGSVNTCNLTNKYYAIKIIEYLKHTYLRNEWKKFISLPKYQQMYEWIAIFIAQWCQPTKNIYFENFSHKLDNMKQKVLNIVEERYPNHPVLRASQNLFLKWKENNIESHIWNITELTQIMASISEYLFHRLEYIILNNQSFDTRYICIDNVLREKKGCGIIVTTIVQTIARRLGVRCYQIIIRNEYILHWKGIEGGNFRLSWINKYMRIMNGQIFNRLDPMDIFKSNFMENEHPLEDIIAKIASHITEMLQYSNNSENQYSSIFSNARQALELQHIIRPKNVAVVLSLSEYYKSKSMQLTEIIKELKSMHEKCKETPQRRTSELKYAVGMIVKFAQHVHETCVIVGWYCDVSYKACGSNAPAQPLYVVLCERGQTRYIPQSYIHVITKSSGNHLIFAKEFEEFTGTHYVPNKALRRLYPDDYAVLQQYFNDNNDASYDD